MLFTASWRALWEAANAGPLPVRPVRISRGTPKFWPQAAAFPAIEALMPDGWMFSIKDAEKFGRCYRRKLHTIGLPRIQALLAEVANGDDRPLALACYEAAVADCHRGMFSLWYERESGQRVPDLAILAARQTLPDQRPAALVYEVELTEAA